MRKRPSKTQRRGPNPELRGITKALTGIRGLDEITGGGFPRGRTTLVVGTPGTGKTLLGMEFLVRGARDFGEPGVFMSFEERIEDLVENVASLGFDAKGLCEAGRLSLDFVRVERHEIEETGEYDLEGLFIRLDQAVRSVGARRVVLDTIESLFAGLSNAGILRAELRRLFGWLKDRGLTTVLTGEAGAQTLTRYGLEEYVSDCVVHLDQRIENQISTRRLRILKYRGSRHGTNEYPFFIGDVGLVVFPITSMKLESMALADRVSSGVPALDAMFRGGGYHRGSTILVSGTAGTGKSSLAATFADTACRRGERVLYFSFEESAAQIVRNMASIGLDFRPWLETDRLRVLAHRPTLYGLEQHLDLIFGELERFRPAAVVIDPITNLISIGKFATVGAMLARLIDHLKDRGITLLCTSLTEAGKALEQSETGVSSLADTWIILRDVESGDERSRTIHILKSRGTAHSHRIRPFVLSDRGIRILDTETGLGAEIERPGTDRANDRHGAGSGGRAAKARANAAADRPARLKSARPLRRGD